jgi:transposase InsO family protein
MIAKGSFPEVFTACAVTRAMRRANDVKKVDDDPETVRLSLSDFPLAVSHGDLVREQQVDPSLKPLFVRALPAAGARDSAQAYFVHDEVLVRKWVPHGPDFVGDPIFQIVVPSQFHSLVLQVSHDECGHMGVRKTYDRILRYFFWPRLKRDVASYIKTCHTCQLTGKPNQSIKPVPLCPIMAIGQPFEHLIIDCVGPLPRSRSGAIYLLTVMCQSTRYPAAYPLRTITTKSVVRALTQFISIFGIPKVIQSDQGSNFSSHLFAQVLKQLRVKHNKASAYHAQGQGALERFHATLKSLLRAYCTQLDGDWEEGLPWLMLGAREVSQESTGFSPNDLVFGHTVRGPLAVLQDDWKNSEPPKNLLHYVNGFRNRLYAAGELAKEKLAGAQHKMKRLYDRISEQRTFSPGDQVLALLPLVGSPFQAKFTGPHTVVKKVSDQNYLIATPLRRKPNQLCHINLLKTYYDRVSSPVCPRPACLANTVLVDSIPHAVAELEEDGLSTPDQSLLNGRLKNSESLVNLDSSLRHLGEVERTQLITLIHNYPSLFGDTPSRTTLIEHDIDVGHARPIRQRFYRVNPEKRKQMDSEIKYMLENNIAVPSSSSWASPCLTVPKPDNTPRFCTDLRKVNNVTNPDSYPRMDDCIDQVSSATFISKFDLLKGYWQVPLSERAREISAFITPSDLCSHTVMPFGLRNAPATFQRLMNMVVRDLEGCAVYLDDVVIYSDNWETHLQRIDALFGRLADACLSQSSEMRVCKGVGDLPRTTGRTWDSVAVACQSRGNRHVPKTHNQKRAAAIFWPCGLLPQFL